MSFTSKTLDILLPPLCLACDAPVTQQGALCTDCWSNIHYIAPPYCAKCGTPFDAPVGDGEICVACLTTPPLFHAARAAMLYDEASKRVILGFKHGDRTHLAGTLAQWMQRAARDFWGDADGLVPVPLHRWRLFKRRYNQAALLARSLGALTQKPVWVDALRRERATPTQGHLNRKQRQANVKGAFALNHARREPITGKNVILIDDVLTTGATLNECSRILLEGGAREVRVLTLARVRGYV